jgi:elongation factor 2 kinase
MQVARNTPQAFSHYTYIVSQGQKLCVDIQGVGDLYTDPQIHTLSGKAYGDGDLGPRGMAYFFRSHECNPLCQRLEMDAFQR